MIQSVILDNGRALAAPVRRFHASNWAPFAKRHGHSALICERGVPRVDLLSPSRGDRPTQPAVSLKALFRRKGLDRLGRQTGDITQDAGSRASGRLKAYYLAVPRPPVPTLRRQLETEMLRTLHVT